MLLVLLPVGVLLGFTIAESADNWQTALSLHDFQTRPSSRSPPPMSPQRSPRSVRRPHFWSSPGQRQPSATARRAGECRRHADRGNRTGSRVGRNGRCRRSHRCGAAALNAVRVELASNSLTAPASAEAYGSIIRDLLRTVRQLDAAAPTQPSARASQAYVAIVEAIEAAAREQADVAALIASQPADGSRPPAPRGGAASRPRNSTFSATTPSARLLPISRPCSSARRALRSPPSAMPSPTERPAYCGNRRLPDGSTHPARGSRPCATCRAGPGRIWPRPPPMTLPRRERAACATSHLACGPSHRDGACPGTAPIDHQPIA